MDKQMKSHSLMREELKRCEDLYSKLSIEKKFLPEGSLAADTRGNYYRCVREKGRQYKVRLSAGERDVIAGLKKRRYICKGLGILKRRIQICRYFVERDTLYDPRKIEKILSCQYSGMRGIDVFLDGDINEEDWIEGRYMTNPMCIAIPHYTPTGLCTRSKSEAMIATRLEERGVPFRYEQEVPVGTGRMFPDFAILNRKRRRIVYLEHLGMIDNEDYMFRSLKKLEEYGAGGIVLGENLFITYESKNRPLSIAAIDAKLEEMLD